MKLWLIRHGMTRGNLRHCYYGSTDLPLCPEGIEALKAVPRPEAEVYYTSGMLRTEQTFAILYGDRPHRAIPELRETDFGDFEMRTYEELKDEPAFRRWISGDCEKNACPGGESAEQTTFRALGGLQPILQAGKDAVCVTHGGVIGNLLMHWFGLKNRYSVTPEPGHGVVVEFLGETPVTWEFL